MKIQKVRSLVMYFIFFGKIILIVWIFVIWLAKGYVTQEALDLLTIIAPLFGAHLGVIIRFYFGNGPRSSTSGQQASMALSQVFLTLTMPIVYLFFMTFVVLLKPLGLLETFDNAKTLIGLGESAFGIYLGQIVIGIFTQGK